MRKLVTIKTITYIQPIPEADLIEVVTVDHGWKVVVKKGEYQINENVLYLEVDSWVPNTIAPFLSKGREPRVYDGVLGERLKTQTFRGQLSQGLILPLSILTGYIDEALDGDFSSVLGVQKWEAPVPAQLSGDVVGGFPTGIPKTDEELVQNLGMVFDEYKNYEYEITEKLEGTSSTFFNIDGNFGVCSRNWNMKESENILYWRIANEYELKNIIQDNTIKNIAIQAEICGPKIQNNYYKLNKHKLFVFNIYDIDNSKYFTPKERLDFCIKNNLNHVPILGTISLHDMTIQDIVLMADGISQINSNVIREGVVFKSINSTHHFKSISSKFLLKVG